jgi:hypothetical protein
MTDEQARQFLEQLASEPRIKAEIVPTSNSGKKANAVKLLFKPDHLVVTIKRVDEWQGVKEAWGLVSEQSKQRE